MINYEDFPIETKDTDPGIDFENYNLDEEIEKYKGAHPQGYRIIVRLYKPKIETRTKGGIILTTSIINKQNEDHKFMNFVGLVVKMAPGCYADKERYKLTGPYCKVGDWVVVPRPHAHTYNYKGLTTLSISEDYIEQVIDDPRDILRLIAN